MSDRRSDLKPGRAKRASGPHRTQICFLIARPRSGTTVFNRMLRTHPGIAAFGEIFNESNPHSFFAFLQKRASTEPEAVLPSRSTEYFMRYIESCRRHAQETNPSCKLLLMGVKYDQAHVVCDPWWKPGQLPKLFFLMRSSGWKVIDIRRRDAARLCLSNRVAIATKVYHLNSRESNRPEIGKIRVDPADLARDIEATEQAYKAVSDHFAGHPEYMRVYYEDMFAETGEFSRSLISAISGFLGLENTFDPRPKLQKLLGGDIFSYFENEDEIRRTIDGRSELPASNGIQPTRPPKYPGAPLDSSE